MVSNIKTQRIFFTIICNFMIIYQGTTNVVSIYNCDKQIQKNSKLPAKYYIVIALNIKYREDIIKYQGPTKWVRPTILNSSHASAIFMKRISFDLKFYSLWLSLLPHIIVMKEKQCTGRRGENNSSCKCLQYKNMYINGCFLSMWNKMMCC